MLSERPWKTCATVHQVTFMTVFCFSFSFISSIFQFSEFCLWNMYFEFLPARGPAACVLRTWITELAGSDYWRFCTIIGLFSQHKKSVSLENGLENHAPYIS